MSDADEVTVAADGHAAGGQHLLDLMRQHRHQQAPQSPDMCKLFSRWFMYCSQLYSFGQTISIPFFRKDWKPDSFYDKIKYNAVGGMHTLCLLGESRVADVHNECSDLHCM